MNSRDARSGLELDDGVRLRRRSRACRCSWDRRTRRAQSYQKFFEIFKDADPDLPLLVQAREEFAKLGS